MSDTENIYEKDNINHLKMHEYQFYYFITTLNVNNHTREKI